MSNRLIRPYTPWVLLGLFFSGTTAFANEQAFNLGSIHVFAEGEIPDYSPIDLNERKASGMNHVGEAIAKEPGVSLQVGGRRAEVRANIRGFDSRQITLNLDGIPIYVPYDGNVDLGRFMLGDLSQIEVTKSLGSLLEGPNNMGGSINLLTLRPQKSFEGEISAAIEAGDKGKFQDSQSVRIGAVLSEKLYLQAGLSAVQTENFPLSQAFEPQVNNGTVYQPKGERLRSGNENLSGNFKLGFTPNATDEYALSYYQTEGAKESSPYAGSQDLVRYWDWPQWDKRSLYFVGMTRFNAWRKGSYLKTRLYHDQFDNALNSYDDDRYRTVTKGYAFRSQYNDTSIGGGLEFGVPLGQHHFKSALSLKVDQHKERDLDSDNKDLDNRWRTFEAETFSLALEDQITLTPNTQLTLGYRQDQYQLTKTDDRDAATEPQGHQNQGNWQIKVRHDFGAQQLSAGLSLKSRFPNIKDQVSYRLGQAIPNLDLQAEQALHYEIALKAQHGAFRYGGNLFYARIQDAIETVAVASDRCGGTQCDQNQNVGNASSQGVELEWQWVLNSAFDLGANYSYLKRDYADSNIVATFSPEHRLNLNLDWFAARAWQFGLDIQAQSSADTRFDGTRPTAGFVLLNSRAHWTINPKWQANLVLKNLLDKNYEIAEGDPMPGRTIWANLNYAF
ncbi:MAG: TonB-dependent receptor [Thiotrichales bacterium]|nr:TonB-dependent receptor [Thiotrichales bacterium]